MALSVGFRLGAYEIQAPLGAGGMGEVYRARDTKLNRDVALKILPETFAADGDRIARLRREAQVLASLNHPNIAAIYGFEDSGTTHALVLELVEGPTLADKLSETSGRKWHGSGLPFQEALRIAIEVAGALEAAHEKGVIHRDLKPSNIKLTNDGKVKVLDFGLAKALGEPEAASDLTNSPTMPEQATRAGVILGTAAYMSPEQAEGRAVDKRTDVWSFGVVLYELLSGRPAFEGKTVSHIILRVLEEEPDFNALPPTTPAAVRDMLERCLQKEPAQRPRDIGDLGLQLQRSLTSSDIRAARTGAVSATRSVPRRRWLWPAVGLLASVAAISTAFLLARRERSPAETVRFEIASSGTLAGSPTLSPDGRKLAFVATDPRGVQQVWIRTLSSLESRPLAGTERVNGTPFWSPDSRFIAFSSDGTLKRIEESGAPPQVLCEAAQVFGGFWEDTGTIVFATGTEGIRAVSAAGGNPRSLTSIDLSRNETAQFGPVILPDGQHFLYTRVFSNDEASGVYIGSLAASPRDQGQKRLLSDITNVVHAKTAGGSDYLLFTRGVGSLAGIIADGTLMAQPFDARSLEVRGEAVPVAEHVPLFQFLSVIHIDSLIASSGTRCTCSGHAKTDAYINSILTQEVTTS